MRGGVEEEEIRGEGDEEKELRRYWVKGGKGRRVEGKHLRIFLASS